MYARNLMIWLHERLAGLEKFERTQERFEKLRAYRLLPVGRENAGVRLSNEQIASSVLSFSHPASGWAGHASLIFGDLRPVGGQSASFEGASTLLEAVARLVCDADASRGLQRVSLSLERNFGDDEYAAQIRYVIDGQKRVVSFVSKLACSLFAGGAEKSYDHDLLDKMSAVQRSFGSDFFRELSEAVSISRQLDRPFKSDWREYETEEELAAFRTRLGARPNSRFLNLRVESLVTWPREPTRMSFGDHQFILFPKTNENSNSISIDLANERISHDDARSLINRMLSIMSWCDDQPASLHEGWSGSPVPVPMPKQNLAHVTTHEWLFCRARPEGEQLQRCLAYYRDGLNAASVGLSSHAVLSFYRVIETKFGQKKWDIIHWIDNEFEAARASDQPTFQHYEVDRETTGLGHGEYIYKWCRVATAHAATDAPSDPDGAEESRRLSNAARVIQRLARYLIKQEFRFSDSYFSNDEK